MRVTIDLIVAGCAARCWHCYIGGGPGPLMPLGEYERCLDALRPLVDRLEARGCDVNLYLDREPLLHPDIRPMLERVRARFARQFVWPTVPTTGIPIGTRPDWEELLESLHGIGVREVELTLHGPEPVQSRAQACPNALQLHELAARRARAHGFGLVLNLMVSRPMLRLFGDTVPVVERNRYDRVGARVPIYEPHDRMRAFEEQRAALMDATPHRHDLAALCTETADRTYWEEPGRYAEAAIRAEVLTHPESYPSFAHLEAQLPAWIFLSVVPGLRLYYGNGGLCRQELGTLAVDSAEAFADRIAALPPNYQFGGYYQLDALPPPVEIAARFGDPESGKLYRSTVDAFQRWLDLASRATGGGTWARLVEPLS